MNIKISCNVILVCLISLGYSTSALAWISGTPAMHKLIVDEALAHDVDPALALAIVSVESNFNKNAVSHAGARGLMQIMPSTSEKVFNVPSYLLFDESVNVNLGVRFIDKLLKRYDNKVEIALSHYNGGSAVNKGNGEYQIIPATRNYVNKVLNKRNEYKVLASQLADGQHTRELVFAQNSPIRTMAEKDVNQLQALRVHNVVRAPITRHNGLAIQGPKRNNQVVKRNYEFDDTNVKTQPVLTARTNVRDYKARTYRGNNNNTQQLTLSPALNEKRARVLHWESVYSR